MNGEGTRRVDRSGKTRVRPKVADRGSLLPHTAYRLRLCSLSRQLLTRAPSVSRYASDRAEPGPLRGVCDVRETRDEGSE